MSETVIVNLKDFSLIGRDSEIKAGLREIFFESSTKKEFSSEEEKEKFFWKYMGFYLANYPEFVWIAHQDFKVLGYILGMPFSQDPSLYDIQPHMRTFEGEYTLYPAHLHINCHADSRGMGLGQKLMAVFEGQLKLLGCQGIHAMTGPESRNRSFYLKLGFDFELTRSGILFVGKDLKIV